MILACQMWEVLFFCFVFHHCKLDICLAFLGGATSMNFDLWDGLMVIFSLTDGDGGQ